MILTDKTTETMRAEEIDLATSDSADNYKDIPIDTPIPEPKTETDIPVEAEATTETEQKAAAFDYLTGKSESSE